MGLCTPHGLITGVDMTWGEAALFWGRGHYQQLWGRCLCPEELWVAQPSTPQEPADAGAKQ